MYIDIYLPIHIHIHRHRHRHIHRDVPEIDALIQEEMEAGDKRVGMVIGECVLVQHLVHFELRAVHLLKWK